MSSTAMPKTAMRDTRTTSTTAWTSLRSTRLCLRDTPRCAGAGPMPMIWRGHQPLCALGQLLARPSATYCSTWKMFTARRCSSWRARGARCRSWSSCSSTTPTRTWPIWTACIHLCASELYKDAFDKLVEFGDDVNKMKSDASGSTPLHLAATCDDAKMVRFLIGKSVNINKFNSRKQTALHLAAEHGAVRACRTLLRVGAVLNTEDKQENTPLHNKKNKTRVKIKYLN